jgi:hypothetical protein
VYVDAWFEEDEGVAVVGARVPNGGCNDAYNTGILLNFI